MRIADLHQSHYLDKHNILNKGNENNPKFYSNEIILSIYRASSG